MIKLLLAGLQSQKTQQMVSLRMIMTLRIGLTVNGVKTGTEEGSGTEGTVGSSLIGTYGTLILNSDGSYTYELDPNNEDLKKLPDGQYYETFTYTITDDTGQTDTAEIKIRINGVNDAPEAVDDKETLDLDTDTELEHFDDENKYLKYNDIDHDRFDNITLNSIRTGNQVRLDQQFLWL